MEERILARGHEHVTAAHGSTLEVTTDEFLTPAGDCIVGIEADCAPADFDRPIVEACQDPNATITLTLAVGEKTDQLRGHGHEDLTFASDRSLVCRTSQYVDDRTVMVGANKAAAGLDRSIVSALTSGADLAVVFAVA